MSFKQIIINNKSYLNYKNNSISIKNEYTNTLVSLDDIDILIIQNQQSTITSALMANLAKANVAVLFVDNKHHPTALSIGLYKNSRTTKIQKTQIKIKKPRLNRLWQSIVYAKVLNQADVLCKIKKDNHLYFLLKQIVSGDKNNIEAVSASYYFKKLFDNKFIRANKKDNRNIALNYGYSIVRSSISRHIIAYGLNPVFGIFHSNELNAFNLADDLIEPFRPIIDYYVATNITQNKTFSSANKQDLVSLLNQKVTTVQTNEQTSTSQAIKNIVSSYQSFCLNKRDDVFLFAINNNEKLK